MRWQQTEFVLKGIYLGLLLFVALQAQDWMDVAYVGIATVGGFLIFLGIAAIRKLREGYRIRGRRTAFVLFLLLENPGLVYAGVMLGITVGAILLRREQTDRWMLLASVGVGAFLGVVFWILRHIEVRKVRVWMSLALGAALVGGTIALFHYSPDLVEKSKQQMIGALLLLGIPMFYLLTFASLVEESEVEIAAMCAALGLGFWILGEGHMTDTFRTMGLVLPLLLYFMYAKQTMPKLRVFKHVLRGMSYASVGRYRWALISLGRALELDPENKWANEEFWNVHRQMDFDEIAEDRETLALVNFELCLERAASLLIKPPTEEQLKEAHRLLNFVSQQQHELLPRCDYWRAVAYTHEKQYDRAAECLAQVLAGGDSSHSNPHRRVILLPAWKFAMSHPQMKQRAGDPQLKLPGRRMEAIEAVERHLEHEPEDTTSWDLKRLVYHDLKESEYNDAVPPDETAEHFDHGYVREIGMALIDDASRWERGAELLRIAARGLPQHGPSIFVQIAKASQKAGNNKGAWENYERAKEAGKAAGPKNVSDEDRKIYFQVVKMLADTKMDDGDIDAAIDNYRLYAEYEGAGAETYRNLAELYERKGDVWGALHANEHALTHSPKDEDLLARKDRYYYSVHVEQVRERLDSIHKWFDGDYCLRKARLILDKGSHDLDNIDWAAHLVELANVMKPSSIVVQLLRGRVRRLRGENEEALRVFEDIYVNRPEKFGGSEEEDAWYAACKVLGDLYLEDQPDKALECFQAYRQYPKSGADTSYKLGRAYEKLGDLARAYKCYEQVTAYNKHPLYPAAEDALRRIRTGV